MSVTCVEACNQFFDDGVERWDYTRPPRALLLVIIIISDYYYYSNYHLFQIVAVAIVRRRNFLTVFQIDVYDIMSHLV